MLKRSKRLLLTICILFVSLVLASCAKQKDKLLDGSYNVKLFLEGGSGRASVEEDTELTVENGIGLLRVIWSSPYYDYMLVDGEKYLPVNEEGNSQFLIKVPKIGEPFTVVADTVAMSKPHEITYELTVSMDGTEQIANNDCSEDYNIQSENIDNLISEYFDKRKKQENSYSRLFTIEILDDNNIFINVNEEEYYLLLSDEKFSELSEDARNRLDKAMNIFPRDFNNIYVVGSASMDYFRTLEALDSVGFSSLNSKEWEIDQVADYIDEGKIKYAGKYSAPDFELLLSEKCDLIVENTMINHSPEILEKLRSLDFNVFIDLSGREETALGRLEWVKLYGYLLGKEELANRLFEEQVSLVLGDEENSSEKKVAFFYVTSTGMISVRENGSYIADMIRSAGGNYIFDGINNYDGTGSKVISVEAFYETARDCDILIYNGTIDGKLNLITDLTDKNEIFAKFKAVENKDVYCTSSGFYQASMELGNITNDIRQIINGENGGNYIYKLK